MLCAEYLGITQQIIPNIIVVKYVQFARNKHV
jgi:hypothetical protein